MFVSKKMFLTKGVGRHREKLNSFEMALRDAGIAHFNIVASAVFSRLAARSSPRRRGSNTSGPARWSSAS